MAEATSTLSPAGSAAGPASSWSDRPPPPTIPNPSRRGVEEARTEGSVEDSLPHAEIARHTESTTGTVCVIFMKDSKPEAHAESRARWGTVLEWKERCALP